MKYCIFCGEKLEDNVGYCPKCGGKQERISCSNDEINYSGGSNETNTMAILAIVFTFVFTFLGLVFGIVGMSKAKQMNGKGYGLSLAAVIISSISIVIEFIGIIILIAFLVSGEFEEVYAEAVFKLLF